MWIIKASQRTPIARRCLNTLFMKIFISRSIESDLRTTLLRSLEEICPEIELKGNNEGPFPLFTLGSSILGHTPDFGLALWHGCVDVNRDEISLDRNQSSLSVGYILLKN